MTDPAGKAAERICGGIVAATPDRVAGDADSWRKDGYGVRIRGAIDTAAELEW